MLFFNAVIFSLDEPNLTRIASYASRIWRSIKGKQQVKK